MEEEYPNLVLVVQNPKIENGGLSEGFVLKALTRHEVVRVTREEIRQCGHFMCYDTPEFPPSSIIEDPM